jgi:hypothetical protein
VATTVRWAIDQGVLLALAQEQDPEQGARPFRHFFDVCPKDLIDAGTAASEIRTRNLLTPRAQPADQEVDTSHLAAGLFNTIAVPLMPTPRHRAVSLLHLARALGAAPLHKRPDLCVMLGASANRAAERATLLAAALTAPLHHAWGPRRLRARTSDGGAGMLQLEARLPLTRGSDGTSRGASSFFGNSSRKSAFRTSDKSAQQSRGTSRGSKEKRSVSISSCCVSPTKQSSASSPGGSRVRPKSPSSPTSPTNLQSPFAEPADPHLGRDRAGSSAV